MDLDIKKIVVFDGDLEYSSSKPDNIVFFHHYLILAYFNKDPLRAFAKTIGIDIWAKVLSKRLIINPPLDVKFSDLPFDRLIFSVNTYDWNKLRAAFQNPEMFIEGQANIGFWEPLYFDELPDDMHKVTNCIHVAGLVDSKRVFKPIVVDGKYISFLESSGVSDQEKYAFLQGEATWLQEEETRLMLNERLKPTRGFDDEKDLHGR